MSSTTAREPRDDKKRTDESLLETDAQFIAGLKVFSGDSESVSGLAGGTAQNSPQAPAGNYLAREGDSMIGPIALGPPVNFRVQIGTDEEINISNLGDSPQYSSNIELDSVQPNGFVLDRIDGAAFDGQILIMRTFGPDSFTISQATLANGGNIQTPTDDDFTLDALQMIILVFDEALQVFANTGGTWRVLTGATGAGGSVGTYASAKMDLDQALNLAVGQHVQFNDYVENGGIVLQGLTPTFDQTSGIFELKAGKTYYLSAYLDMIFNANVDLATFHWWDITNGVAVSQVMTPQPTNAANTNTMNLTVETIFTPVTDVLVELRIASVVGVITTIFKDGSQANIFEFSGKNGAQGPAGSPGAGQNWKEPARALDENDVSNLASFNVIVDGITLVEDDRVLLTGQTTLSENGLWEVGVVAAGFAPLTRPDDFDTDAEVVAETFVPIEEGSQHKDTLWHLISNNPIAIDVSDQVWKQFGGGQGIGPDMGQDNDGIDATGNFVFDGRIYHFFDYMKRVEQLWNLRVPCKEIGSLYYIEAESYQHGDFGGGGTPATNPNSALVCVGDRSNNLITSSVSRDMGNSWSSSTDLNSGGTWRSLAYDPVGKILCCISRTGNNLHNIGRSPDKGLNWGNATSNPVVSPQDLIWVASYGLFILVSDSTGVDVIWTSPDGNAWTQRTTLAATPDPPAISGRYSVLAYDANLDKVFCVGAGITSVLTSTDGINWINETMVTPLAFGDTPFEMIHSAGQEKFMIIPGRFTDPAVQGYHTSPDGFTWTKHLTMTMFSRVSDIAYSNDYSSWVAVGTPNTGERQPFIISNDGVNWRSAPEHGVLRNQEYDFANSDSQSLLTPRNIARNIDQFGYIFAIGNNDRTGLDNFFYWTRFWRTQVYFNNAGTVSNTFRDDTNPH